MRSYKCLSKSEYSFEQYKLVTIRDEDKYLILQWRNEQIINLRQKKNTLKGATREILCNSSFGFICTRKAATTSF